MLTRGFLISLSIEFGPVVAFFIVSQLGGFYAGTAALVGATLLALIASLIRDKRIPVFSFISSGFILLFGILTLVSMEARWLVLEYTLYNGLFGIAIILGLLRGRALLKPLFQSMFHISERGWRALSLRWGLFFIATALANEYVWRTYDQDTWVYFRFVAAFVLCVFGFSQFFLARRERLPHASPWGLRR